jgi:hypothetical protein
LPRLLSYPFTRILDSRRYNLMLRYRAALAAQIALINTNPFALELIKAQVVTLYPLIASIHLVVNCFLPINCLKSILEKSTLILLRKESCSKHPRFPDLYLLTPLPPLAYPLLGYGSQQLLALGKRLQCVLTRCI